MRSQDIRSGHVPWPCEEMGLKIRGASSRSGNRPARARSTSAANTLTKKADEVQILKYALQNVAHGYGKTLTFMPKPHRRRQRQRHARAPCPCKKTASRMFAGDKYGGLVRYRALLYRRHHQACARLECIHQCQHQQRTSGWCRGSRRRLKLAYSARNRSASIRIPWIANPKGRRIEVRFPDCHRQSVFCLSLPC